MLPVVQYGAAQFHADVAVKLGKPKSCLQFGKGGLGKNSLAKAQNGSRQLGRAAFAGQGRADPDMRSVQKVLWTKPNALWTSSNILFLLATSHSSLTTAWCKKHFLHQAQILVLSTTNA